jgi:hypothetical protein
MPSTLEEQIQRLSFKENICPKKEHTLPIKKFILKRLRERELAGNRRFAISKSLKDLKSI